MIFKPDAFTRQPVDSTLVSHLLAEIDAVCDSSLLGNDESLRDLAKSVEFYLKQDHSLASVDSSCLVLLASQALSSLGEGNAARRLLLFGSGLVRPSEWEVTGNQAVWILDLRQMTLRSDTCLEIIFFSSLNLVIESIADVWDATDGKGVLGLRHVCESATEFLGGNGKVADSLAQEILDACLRKLEKTGATRGWAFTPDVMRVDV